MTADVRARTADGAATPPVEAHSPQQGTVRDELAYDRTHLANQRTFAAWLRTGLSVAAGGIAVAHLVPEPARDSSIALALGAAFVVLGVGVTAYGAHQYARVADALCVGSTRRTRARVRAAYALTAFIALLLLAVLWFLWSHRGTARADAGAGATRTSVFHARAARWAPLANAASGWDAAAMYFTPSRSEWGS